MVFKLIRTDSEEPCKIQLCIGKHVLGRGKFLDCDDKRVSRNHGELEVMEDTVIVKALHQNPCFIIRKESADTQILEQNCSSSISNGDRFGLLPHTYWYELLHCSVADDDQQPKSAVSDVNEDMDSVATEPFEAEKDMSQEINDVLNETVANNESPGSPSMLPTESSELAAATTAETTIDNKEGGKFPIKRSHSPQSIASKLYFESSASIEASSTIKKIKMEDEQEMKQEPADIRDSSIAATVIDNDQVGLFTSNYKGDGDGPSTSNDKEDGEGPSTSNDKGNGQDPSTSNSKGNGKDPSTSNDKGDGDNDAGKAPASPLKRERCMYGANCYRRNPAHKAQFSHPPDADWGADERAPCPWGAACRRRDPRHWRDHDHPPGVQPPAAGNNKRQAKKRPESDDDDDGDDDSGNNSPILNKKRTRKTITIQNNWDDSDSLGEEDPYATDDEDSEWQPLGKK